ncbi:unnamed protein product [Colias eurytheme]|nr:unnamed protein product [Colias eurytheme]
MRSLRLLRCRPFSTRFLILSFLALAFGIYCYYYTVTPASYPKPSKWIFLEISRWRKRKSGNLNWLPSFSFPRLYYGEGKVPIRSFYGRGA